MTGSPIRVGVVGAGTMGYHHARVYREMLDATLVGVVDVDDERAQEVADEFDTRVMDRESLFSSVDAVSIAVPTEYHYHVAREAIDAGTSVLVEKPFVDRISRGRELVSQARERGVVLQVGHIERFNPAVSVLGDVIAEEEVIAIDAQRLGPPPDREITDSPVMDLMIHDIDVLCSLVPHDVVGVSSARARDAPRVTAILEFENGVVGTLTASRITQQKVRTLSVTARECRINLDYIAQSVRIHRRSVPEHVVTEGDVRYRHESLIEQPTVKNGEPLKAELRSFVESVRTGTPPAVSGEDGIRAIELAQRVEEALEEPLQRASLVGAAEPPGRRDRL